MILLSFQFCLFLSSILIYFGAKLAKFGSKRPVCQTEWFQELLVNKSSKVLNFSIKNIEHLINKLELTAQS